MKKIINGMLITIFSCLLCILLSSCVSESDDWKNADINGYYSMGIGSSASYTHWGLELYDEEINDATKTFVVSYMHDSYNHGIIDPNATFLYVSYGYYTINKVYKENDYIEYHLNLEYIVKDKNAPSWNTMTVTVTQKNVYCIYNSQKLYKQ